MTAKERRYGSRSSKFNNRRTQVDGIWFDSDKEARRYQELKLLERAGEIRQVEVHFRYPITVERKHICDYESDFTYFEGEEQVIEDVKGVKTAVYKLKKKLIAALYGIVIRET